MEYQEDIIRLVDLATLVPVLDRYKLLTLTENSSPDRHDGGNGTTGALPTAYSVHGKERR